MKKLNELLEKPPLKGDVGIEIECEGKGFLEINSAFWSSKDDGSLRGRFPVSRIEYIINGPVPLEQVKPALEELNLSLKTAVPNFSFRTSVHVHVNILDLTEDQLLSYIYTYLLLEEVLFQYCGNTRKANRFCLRLQDADVITTNLSRIFRGGVKEIKNLNEEEVRYSALNIAAVNKFGSVEFRGMRGTLDVNTLTVWCNALVSIRNYACHQVNCLAVHDEFVQMGSEGFLKHVLGGLSQHFIYPKMDKDINRSFSLSIDLPYHYKMGMSAPKVEKKVPLFAEIINDHLNQPALEERV